MIFLQQLLGVFRDETPPLITSLTLQRHGNSRWRSVHVEASDNVRVTRIDVLLDGVLVGRSVSSPYDLRIRVAPTPQQLTAIAYDAAGHTASASMLTE